MYQYQVDVFSLNSIALEHGRTRFIRCCFPVPSLVIALSLPTWYRVYSPSGLVARRSSF